MRIEPLLFRDFESNTAGAITAHRKPHLPGGRRKEEAPPPPPPPSFSEDELKAAEREAYKKGFLEGTDEGIKQAQNEQATIDRELTETVEKFAKTVAPLLNDYQQMILQMRQDMPKVALAIAKKVAGDALDKNAQGVIDEVAMRCVETMIGEPRLAITVHSCLTATLEKKLQLLAERLQSATKIIVVGDDALQMADCRIEWKHGALERHTGQLWAEIERVVQTMIASSQRDTTNQIANVEKQISTDTKE